MRLWIKKTLFSEIKNQILLSIYIIVQYSEIYPELQKEHQQIMELRKMYLTIVPFLFIIKTKIPFQMQDLISIS